jgi:Domain of unknown function (DUF4296)
MRRVLLNALTLLVYCFAACSNKNNLPDGVLPPAKMQLVLLDIMEADALNNERAIKDTSLRVPAEDAAYYQTIFQLHKITREDFAKSYRFYLKRPDLLKPITDSLNSVVTRKNTELETKTMKADSVKTMNKDSLKKAGGDINLMKKDSFLKGRKFKLLNKDSINNGRNIKNAAGQDGHRQ